MQALSLVLKVIWAPGEALAAVSQKPNVLVPLIFLSLVSLGTSIATFSKLDLGEIALRQAEQAGRTSTMTDEQKANMLRVTRVMTPVVVGFAAITPALVVLIAASIYFGVFTLIGREAAFKTFFAVTAFAYVPFAFRSIVAVVQAYTTPLDALDTNNLGALSPAVFIDPTSGSRALYLLLTVFDVTSIWIAVLLIIGYKFVVKKSVSTGLRVGGVVSVYAFFSLAAVGLRFLFGR